MGPTVQPSKVRPGSHWGEAASNPLLCLSNLGRAPCSLTQFGTQENYSKKETIKQVC